MKKLKETKRIKEIEEEYGKDIEDLLYEWHWEEGLTHSKISDKIDVPRPSITRWFKNLGISTRDSSRITVKVSNDSDSKKKEGKSSQKPRAEQRKGVNEDFFKEWTNDMAYVLGFFAADGCIFVNPRGSRYIEFDSTDEELIQRVKSTLDCQNKIGVRQRNEPNWNDRYVLEIGSKEMFRDLKELGFGSNKSKELSFPRVPEEYLSHFVRGYFDGDGCVFFKDYTKNKNSNTSRVVLSTSFVSGCQDFLKDLASRLRKFAFLKGGSISEKNRGYQLSYSKKDSIRLFEFMYRKADPSSFLERKHDLFMEYLNY